MSGTIYNKIQTWEIFLMSDWIYRAYLPVPIYRESIHIILTKGTYLHLQAMSTQLFCE